MTKETVEKISVSFPRNLLRRVKKKAKRDGFVNFSPYLQNLAAKDLNLPRGGKAD